MSSDIRILLVDDHALVREVVGRVLDSEPGFAVVEMVGNTDEAIERSLNLLPDIVIMDIDMPGMICFDAAERITSLLPATQILFLSAFCRDHYIEQVLGVRAMGYVMKSEPSEVLFKAIKQAFAGRVYFSPEVRSRLVADTTGIRLAQTAHTRATTLSSREIEVLRYLACGSAKRQIARTMHLSVKTVEGHATRVMAKVDIHDRVQLARFAIREGLVEA